MFIELTIDYGFTRTNHIYLKLPLLMTQLLAQRSIAAWSEIKLIDFVAAITGILRLRSILIRAYILEK